MDVWHIKLGGIRVVGSGASIADDWTDANCFDPNALAGSRWWNVLRDYMLDGDEMIFDGALPGLGSITHDLPTGNMLAALNAGVLTLKSRYENQDGCTIRCLTDTNLLQCKPNATAGISYVFTGIKFAEPTGGLTFAGATFIAIQNLCGDVTFNDCSLGNCELGATTEQLQGLVYSDNVTARTVTYNNTNIENITSSATWYGGSYWMQTSANTTVNITGACNIRNITLTPLNGIRGGLFDNASVNITGNVVIGAINNTVNATKFNRAVFYGGTGHYSITGSVTGDNVTLTGGTSGCALVQISNTFDINKTGTGHSIKGTNITITQGSGENSVGAVFVALGVAAIGYVRKVIAEDVKCFSGSCVYFSDGASGLAESMIARRNHSGENGAIYSGGYGDTTFKGFLIDSCTSDEAGAGVFAHNHRTGGGTTRNKTVTIQNGVIVNCIGNLLNVTAIGDGHGIYADNSDNTGFTQTTNIDNVICRNGGSEEMLFTEVGDAQDVNITTCDVEGGASVINDADILLGTVTKTDIRDDAAQITSTYKLASNSTYKRTGQYLRYGSRDCEGVLYGLPVPLGGYSVAGNVPDTRQPRI